MTDRHDRIVNPRSERAINAEPWEPLPWMIKRRCADCRFLFATPADAQSALCPDCTIADRRRRHGRPLRIVRPKQHSLSTPDLTSRRDQRMLIDLAEDYDARAAEAERKAGEEP